MVANVSVWNFLFASSVSVFSGCSVCVFLQGGHGAPNLHIFTPQVFFIHEHGCLCCCIRRYSLSYERTLLLHEMHWSINLHTSSSVLTLYCGAFFIHAMYVGTSSLSKLYPIEIVYHYTKGRIFFQHYTCKKFLNSVVKVSITYCWMASKQSILIFCWHLFYTVFLIICFFINNSTKALN